MFLFERPLYEVAWLVLGALLLGISFSFPSLWLVGVLGFLPLLFLILNKQRSLLCVFLFAWLFGFVYLGTVLVWFWHVLPLDWLGVESAFLAVLLVFVTWFLLSLVLSLSIALWAVVSRFVLLKTNSKLLFVFATALLWVLFEYIRMWSFSLFTFGEGTLLGAHFSVGMAGYILANHPILLQLASFGGVYMLSFCLVLILSMLVVKGRKYSTFVTLFGILFVTSLLPVPTIPFLNTENTKASELRVALITTYNEPQLTVSKNEQERRLTVLQELIAEVNATEIAPDIVVLPEDARFARMLGEKKLDAFFAGQSYLFLDSARTTTELGTQLFITYHNLKENTAMQGGKSFLIPYGEYVPWVYQSFLSLFGYDDFFTRLKQSRSYILAEPQSGIFNGIIIGARSCSEILSPSIYRQATEEENADILVSMASQSIFHNSRALFNQTVSIAKVRAVESRRDLVLSGNGFPSFVINKKGVLVAQAAWGKPSVLWSSVLIENQVNN